MAFLGLSYIVLVGNVASDKITVLPSGTLSQTLNFASFSACLFVEYGDTDTEIRIEARVSISQYSVLHSSP